MARLAVALVAAVLTIVAAPASGAPCAGFTDVDDTSPFCPSVAWMKNRSITTGCTLTEYCPSSPVSRLAMAAFMNRLADSLFPLTCGSGQIMKWNGASWTCANDNAGGGGGTVTSVSAGTGLQGSPNPITSTGAINLAPSYQLPQGCSNGQVAKSNGLSGWTCAADAGGAGTVTSITAGTGLTGGTITGSGTIAADTNYLQRRVAGTCAAGSSIRTIAADGTVTCETDDAGPANAYVQGGNAFGATAVLGTTDNRPLDIRVNGSRATRFEPNAVSPNVIGGNPNNSVTGGVRGATIAGGGVASNSDLIFLPGSPNRVTAHYGTVGGGYANRAGGDDSALVDRAFATVSGGTNNIAGGFASAIGGGAGNTAINVYVAIAGGLRNSALADGSAIGGGDSNSVTGTGLVSTIAGGRGNTASGGGSSVVGGINNTASGGLSTVGGGEGNLASGQYSFAAGRRAKANAPGSFVWADSTNLDFPPALLANFFAVRATGGVGFTVKVLPTGVPEQFCNYLPNTAGWVCTSDREAKENLVLVDAAAVLDRLTAMPLFYWNFKGAGAEFRNLGPTAQDFQAAFGLSRDDKTIASGHVEGVALAAIQGLNAKLEEREAALRAEVGAKDAEIAALRSESDALKREMADLRAANQKEMADLRLAVEVLMARTLGEGRVAQGR